MFEDFIGSSWYFLDFLGIRYLFEMVWTCLDVPFATCLGLCLYFFVGTGRCSSSISSCRSGTCWESAIATSTRRTRRFLGARDCRMVVIGCVECWARWFLSLCHMFIYFYRFHESPLGQCVSQNHFICMPQDIPKSCSRSIQKFQESSNHQGNEESAMDKYGEIRWNKN